MLKEIKNDVFNISNRIKEINKNYIVYFNTEIKKYELYHKKYGYCLTFPYDELDSRCIEYTLSTRADRIDVKKFVEDIDRYNENIEKKAIEAQIDKTTYEAKEILKFVGKSVTREVTEELIKEVEGVK